MKPRSLAYQFPTRIYIKHEEKNLAHLDTHMIGKFYCKNVSNAASAGRFGITDGVEIFLPLLKLASKLLLFSYFMKVAGTEIQDQIMSLERYFSFAPWMS